MNNRPRILVVGSFVMDLIVSTARFPQKGETVLGCGYQTAPGGKGANQAVQAARLGAEVTMVGKVGDDAFGKELLASARQAGVDVSRVAVSAENHSAIGNVQLEVGNGQTANRIIVVSGANMAITPADVAFLEEGVAAYDLVVLQLEIPMEINEQMAVCANAAGVPVMLNPAPAAPLSETLLRHIACVSPNETEAEVLTGCTLTGTDGRIDDLQVQKAARQLLDRGAPSVLITLGESGAVLFGHGTPIRTPCAAHVPAVDPTAAGDSFIAAFCHARCIGYGPEAAMDYASRAAAITVSRKGAIPALPCASIPRP